eukprot:jgi/Picre1/34657/NNA_002125.t1
MYPYDQLPVNQGDDYVIGFAYWPGGVWEDWNLTLPGDTRGIPTLNPCLGEVFYNHWVQRKHRAQQDNIAAFTSGKVGDYNKILSDNNVVFASFTAETDIMASFSIPASEQRKLLDAAQGSSVLTVTAFRGNISSPPMFISSKSPELTKGSGIVKRIGLTIGLDKGILVPGGLHIDQGILELLKCHGLHVLLGILVRDPKGTVAKQLLWTLKLVAKYDAKLLGDCLASNPEAVSSLGWQLKSTTPSVVLNTLQTLQLCAMESTEFVKTVSSMFDQTLFMCLLESQNRDVVLQSLRLHLHIINNMWSSPPASDSEEIIKMLKMKARQPNDVDLRLAACNCIVALFRHSARDSMSAHQEPYILATLMDLISLLDEKCVDAVRTMRQLALADEKLGSTIIELDILPKMIPYLEEDNDRHVIDVFSFIADLCDTNELARRQCLESGILSAVCNSLNSPARSVQVAACACFHMLSRSVRGLKMHVSTISKSIVRLLELARQCGERSLQLHAVSVLANLCSEPNNLRETLMKNGILTVFLEVYRSNNVSEAVREKSLLGIASLAYVSTRDIKQLISSSITQDDVKDLLDDIVPYDMMEHALILIRNMSHNFGPASSPLREHWDLDFILDRSLDIGTRDESPQLFKYNAYTLR